MRPEDDGEHGEADGHGQTQVQVEQDGAEEGDQPHQLGSSREESAVGLTAAAVEQQQSAELPSLAPGQACCSSTEPGRPGTA